MYLEPADAEITPLVSPKNTTRPTDYATRLSKKKKIPLVRPPAPTVANTAAHPFSQFLTR